MKVLVYGGTGAQANPLAQLLREREYDVRVLTRDPVRAALVLPAGATAVKGDFDDADSLQRASSNVDAVSFMIPAFIKKPENFLLYAQRAMEAAAAGGVKLIVWNTGGRFPEAHPQRALDQAMLAVWNVLKSAGLPLIVIAPTTYMENLLGPGPLNAIRTRDEVAYPVLAERKMGWIAARDVSAFVVAALERPHFAGRIFRVSGEQGINGPELADAFSSVLGRPFKYRTLTPAEMREALEEAYGEGAGDEVAEEYGFDQSDPNPPAKHYDMRSVLNDLPIRMTDIKSWIAAHAEEFRRSRGMR